MSQRTNGRRAKNTRITAGCITGRRLASRRGRRWQSFAGKTSPQLDAGPAPCWSTTRHAVPPAAARATAPHSWRLANPVVREGKKKEMKNTRTRKGKEIRTTEGQRKKEKSRGALTPGRAQRHRRGRPPGNRCSCPALYAQ